MPRDAYWPVRPEASLASWNLMDDILSTWRLCTVTFRQTSMNIEIIFL